MPEKLYMYWATSGTEKSRSSENISEIVPVSDFEIVQSLKTEIVANSTLEMDSISKGLAKI